MSQLEHTTIPELHDQLSSVDKRVPAERVLAAIAYKQGDSKRRIAERHDVSWKTIDNWLDRFENRPIENAPHDERRSGRPPKLTAEQRDTLFRDLQRSPDAFGYDRRTWSPSLVRYHVREEFDVEYSPRHVRRLMDEAGVA